jgi:hypothetical protein
MMQTGQTNTKHLNHGVPDVEITDADFMPADRIVIDESDLPPQAVPPEEIIRARLYAHVLGLSGCVTRDDVRRVYRELARQYHPDKVQHLGPKLREVADSEIRQLNEAYAYFRERYGPLEKES